MLDNNTQMRTMLKLLEGVAHGTQQLNESIEIVAEPAVQASQSAEHEDDDMAKNQIHTIKRAAEALEHIIQNDRELPQWIHSKITIAQDYLDTVRDYLASAKERDVEQATGEEGVDESIDSSEDAGVKYGVFSTGGSVGSQRFKDEPIKTFDDKEEAKAYARDRRAGLSKGERGYYRMSYVVKSIKG